MQRELQRFTVLYRWQCADSDTSFSYLLPFLSFCFLVLQSFSEVSRDASMESDDAKETLFPGTSKRLKITGYVLQHQTQVSPCGPFQNLLNVIKGLYK